MNAPLSRPLVRDLTHAPSAPASDAGFGASRERRWWQDEDVAVFQSCLDELDTPDVEDTLKEIEASMPILRVVIKDTEQDPVRRRRARYAEAFYQQKIAMCHTTLTMRAQERREKARAEHQAAVDAAAVRKSAGTAASAASAAPVPANPTRLPRETQRERHERESRDRDVQIAQAREAVQQGDLATAVTLVLDIFEKRPVTRDAADVMTDESGESR